jgi:aspartyl protease family protein
LLPSDLSGVCMAFSSGTKTAMGEAVSWLIAGASLIVAFIYLDELKAGLFPISQGQSVQDRQLPHKTSSNLRAQWPRAATAPTANSGNMVRLRAGLHGHYRTSARLNGRSVDVLVDTGATNIGLTYADAQRAGIYVNDSDFKYKTRTANGLSRIAIVHLDRVAIGDIVVRNVRATVSQPGKLGITLLGMSFMSKLRRAEMRDGLLILEN